MLAKHELGTIAARAFVLLIPSDRKHIQWDMLLDVVRSFSDTRDRVKDVGEAITYTLRGNVRIKNGSREEFTAWARLLRKVEYEVGLSAEEKRFAPIREDELLAAVAELRKDKRYEGLIPPNDQPKFEISTFRRMARELASRRRPRLKLLFLAGTVVREEVPDVDPATRLVGQAYKSGFSLIFRGRKKHQGELRARQAEPQTEHPVAPDPQYRLV